MYNCGTADDSVFRYDPALALTYETRDGCELCPGAEEGGYETCGGPGGLVSLYCGSSQCKEERYLDSYDRLVTMNYFGCAEGVADTW